MGKAKEERIQSQRNVKSELCEDVAAPICECCLLDRNKKDGSIQSKSQYVSHDDNIKEIVVIGAGPHSMSLILRLLQPNADLMSESERHCKAEYHSKKMRSVSVVRRYVRNLLRGNPAILMKKCPKIVYTKDYPPPIELEKLRESALILDRSTPAAEKDSGWLSLWNKNFDAMRISYLRSPTSAHLDPFDYRTLDVYADYVGRDKDLISLRLLTQRDKEFNGPYQAPSTALFKDFHSVLAKAYGIDDIVENSVEVLSIVPRSGSERLDDEPYFDVHFKKVGGAADKDDDKTGDIMKVKAKRVICAMGPMFHKGNEFWESSLPPICHKRLLHCHEIVPWLDLRRKHHQAPNDNKVEISNLLIVGGGITSTHLALLAARASWCNSVTVIQRSQMKERQFDIENKWMGPTRGKLLGKFWSRDYDNRVQFLKEVRKGGSVPPELAHKLLEIVRDSKRRVQLKQEVQISDVFWTGKRFRVQMDDGSSEEDFDMIWMATGADNDIELYKPLQRLLRDLPIDTTGGLPVLNSDLTWKRSSSIDEDSEASWKGILRRRLHVLGCLAGLELGPDALNLIGARHGSVRVAKALRLAMYEKDQLKN